MSAKNNKSRRQKRNDRWARINSRNTPVVVKPDHTVVVNHIQLFSTNNLQNGFFDSYEPIGPHNILANSSWRFLLDIYESVRVTRIDMKCYFYGVSINTVGTTAAMCFRDVLTATPNRVYEQLAVEPGHKRGRPATVFSFRWVPIEPSDYEFYDHSQFAQMDGLRYGQLNYAGAGFPGDVPKPVIEFKVWYDFKHLHQPVATQVARLMDSDPSEEDWHQPNLHAYKNSSNVRTIRPNTAK